MSADSIWTERHAVDDSPTIRIDLHEMRMNLIFPRGTEWEVMRMRKELNNQMMKDDSTITNTLLFHRGPNGGIDTNRACIVKGN